MKNLTQVWIKIPVCFCLVVLSINLMQAQSRTNTASPAITFRAEKGELKLTCQEGCAWTDLSFTVPTSHKQIVTEYGMSTRAESDAMPANPALSRFTFSVIANKRRKITVENIEGMSFKKVKFSEKDKSIVMQTKD